jgi:hypothetical protein
VEGNRISFEVVRVFNGNTNSATYTGTVAEFSETVTTAGRSTYRVRAKNTNGTSPWSNPAWVGQ